ncbi:MAG: hypothetical protein ACRC7G_01865 [Beijerinckiaceae bacterium]
MTAIGHGILAATLGTGTVTAPKSVKTGLNASFDPATTALADL